MRIMTGICCGCEVTCREKILDSVDLKFLIGCVRYGKKRVNEN